MAKKFTGIKLNFSEDGECVKIIRGREVLPHRVDLIKQKLSNCDLSGIENMFFNFTLKGCRTASTAKHIKIENALVEQYFNLIETGGFTPDAA